MRGRGPGSAGGVRAPGRVRLGLGFGLAALTLAAQPVAGAGWSECARELRRLERTVDDLEDEAHRADRAAGALRRLRAELAECLRGEPPGNCRVVARRYRAEAGDGAEAREDFDEALEDLEDDLEDLEDACGIEIGRHGRVRRGEDHRGPDPAQDFCRVIRDARGVPPDLLEEVCREALSAAACRACAGAP